MRRVYVFLVLWSFLGLFCGVFGLLSITSVRASAAAPGSVTVGGQVYELSSENPYCVVVPQEVKVGVPQTVYMAGCINGTVVLTSPTTITMTESKNGANSAVCSVKMGNENKLTISGNSSEIENPQIVSEELLVDFKNGYPLIGKWTGKITYSVLENYTKDITDYLNYTLNSAGTEYTISGVKYSNILSVCKNNLRLPSVYNGKPVTAIGENVFNCRSGYPLADVAYHSGVYTVTIPESVVSIGTSAFEGFGGKGTKVIIEGNGLKKIGDSAFETSFLSSINFPESLGEIGPQAFMGSNISNTAFPDSLRSIGESAFYYCQNFKGTLNLPSSITSIGRAAFSYCKGITIANWVCNKMDSIPKECFSNCTALRQFNMSSESIQNLLIVNEKAFMYCKALNKFTVGPKTNTIGRNAFYGTGVLEITLPANTTYYSNSFPNGCTITYM